MKIEKINYEENIQVLKKKQTTYRYLEGKIVAEKEELKEKYGNE